MPPFLRRFFYLAALAAAALGSPALAAPGFQCPTSGANVTWVAVNNCIASRTPDVQPAIIFGANRSLELSTDRSTNNVEGLISLQSLNHEAKATIAYKDQSGLDVIWLQTHDYLSYPTNRHKHFSIEASDSKGLKQSRLSVGYGADNVAVTVNQADLTINRNTGMTNGNIVMAGGGRGGVFKHAEAFRFYPSYTSNGSTALQVGLASGNQLRMGVSGSDKLFVDDTLVLRTGSSSTGTAPLKFIAGPLLSRPENGVLEYDGTGLYFTSGGSRTKLGAGGSGGGGGTSGPLRRVAVNDADYVVQENDQIVAFTGFTRPRTIVLPTTTTPGRVLIVKDESGQAASFGIDFAGGSIDGGGWDIREDYGSLEIYSNGSEWFTK